MSTKKSIAIRAARQKAKIFMKEHHINSVPVNLKKIIKELDINLIYGDFEGNDDISALIKREGKDKRPVIVINKNHSPVRQRFSIAHELAHYVLHTNSVHVDEGEIIKYRDHRASLAEDLHEIQANQFAAEILMPENRIKKDILEAQAMGLNEDFTTFIAKIAEKYKVSEEAMTYRVGRLLN